MKVGDEVIIDPYTDIDKKEAGIFRIEKCLPNNMFLLGNGFQYPEDCLILADPFEVGDVVTIRQNIDRYYFPHGFTLEMNDLLGRKVTISKKSKETNYTQLGAGKYFYYVEEDNNHWVWPLCAFSKIIKKSSKDESRLQKQDSSFDRRSREDGIRVRSRKHRARVEISSLKHQKIIGRR